MAGNASAKSSGRSLREMTQEHFPSPSSAFAYGSSAMLRCRSRQRHSWPISGDRSLIFPGINDFARCLGQGLVRLSSHSVDRPTDVPQMEFYVYYVNYVLVYALLSKVMISYSHNQLQWIKTEVYAQYLPNGRAALIIARQVLVEGCSIFVIDSSKVVGVEKLKREKEKEAGIQGCLPSRKVNLCRRRIT